MKFNISYGKGKPGITSETIEAKNYREACQYAADHASGWGYYVEKPITVRDLLRQEIDIDVVDDFSDDLWIAFCGALNLTEVGEKKFSAVLDLPVELRNCGGDTVACVLLGELPNPDCERLEHKCIELFEAAAGYCSAEEWDEWFYTCDRPFGANCI